MQKNPEIDDDLDLATLKLKIFCEYLFLDFKTNKCTFLQFDALIKLISGVKIFNTLHIFIEILGKKRKYLTYARFKIAYNLYRTGNKEYTPEVKGFFAYIFESVIKNPNEKIGNNYPNCYISCDTKTKMRENMNNLKVYSKNKIICGFYFEYDNTIKSKVIMKNIESYDTVISMDMKSIKLDSKKKSIFEDSVRDHDMIDYITHIIGNFSNKIEFLGFKTANGKFYFYGNPEKGDPFILGKFNEKLHSMKIGFYKDGICSIEPYFKKALFISEVPINDNYYCEPKYLFDELIIKEFKNLKEIEYALYYHDEDNDVFTSKDENDISGIKFNDLFYPDDIQLPENHPFNQFEKTKKDDSGSIVTIDNFGFIDISEYLIDPLKYNFLYKFIENEIKINSKKNSLIEIFPSKKKIQKYKILKFNQSFFISLWKNYSNCLMRKLVLNIMKKNYIEKQLKEIQIKFNQGDVFTLQEQISCIKIMNRFKGFINIMKISSLKNIEDFNNNRITNKSIFSSLISGNDNGKSMRMTTGTRSIYKENSEDFTDVKGKLDKTLVFDLIDKKEKEVYREKQFIYMNTIKELEDKKKKAIITRAFSFNDYKMPENIKILFSQKIPKIDKFTDSYFPAEFKSLIPLDEEKNIIIPKDVNMEEISDWKDIKWARAEEIFKSLDFQVFIDNIEPNDILQGNIGNCYFLAAIASLADYGAELVTSRFLFHNRSNESCYGIYMRLAGIWKLVLLDDYFPVVRSYRRYELSFARSNENELWVILFEKAWAKICGSYVNTIGGFSNEVFSCITNSFTEVINTYKLNGDLLWEKLMNGQNNKFLMSAGSGKNNNNGIVSGHAYSILGIKELSSENVRLIKLRNPYGEVEWTGDWSDKSEIWTEKLKKELNFKVKDDGIFWMNYSDFITYFEIVNICKIHKDFNNYEIHISKKETVIPTIIELNLVESSLVYIQIHQKYCRFRLKDGTYPEQILFNLILLDENFEYVESIYSKKDVECIERVLNKGIHYLLSDINYRFNENSRVHGYSISTYSEKKCILTKNTNLNSEKVLRKAISSYAKKNIKPLTSKNFGNEVKFYKRLSNPFPGQIFLFENNSSKELYANLKFANMHNCGIYNFVTHKFSHDNHLTTIIHPHSEEIAYLRFASGDYEVSHIEQIVNGQYFPIGLK